ncbi:LOG family protein [Aliarcobacter skirrowii]|uniref:LOG family protein n=1 Tax=Aliarcobacter skirrowii TaxID=28200 RepID=UPI0029A4AD93|nr:TIGR00730 family Rossman fold protein [Aliarcobacter skirrowii]MDX4035944.1 TIGR00730 family Rossman fold protein [Aliarcobacter skirrowii]MDX4063693.1 TIGR00730 family Rossman fold protein [Aliarcobacter skirrowii]
MNIAIYCGSAFGNSKIYEEKTIQLAQKLAKESINIVYGGSKQGLMGVISNESLKLKNKVIGVITYDLVDKELENTSITQIYKVDSMKERKAKMEELSDAFIALPGGYGTFEEIIDVIASAQIGYHKKPCAFLNVNGYYDKLIEFFYSCSENGFMNRRFIDMLIVSDDIDYIIEKIKNYEAPKAKWEN